MGLHISVYRDRALGDCTNGGVSSKHDELTVVNIEGPVEPSKSAPAVILERHMRGALRLVPAVKVAGNWQQCEGWYMAGGNFGHTSDSRFADACEARLGVEFYGAVAIHDRTEEERS